LAVRQRAGARGAFSSASPGAVRAIQSAQLTGSMASELLFGGSTRRFRPQ